MKYFIDCGAHKGKILNLAQRYYGDTFKYYAFECNNQYIKTLSKNTIIIDKAVWIYDGFINFFINTTKPTIEGNSLYSDKITGNLDTSKPIKISCIDFSNWINQLSENEYCVIKMNIEGSEYDVLEKMFQDGTINKINELIIRWHAHKIPSISKERHNKLRDKLFKTSIKIYENYEFLK